MKYFEKGFEFEHCAVEVVGNIADKMKECYLDLSDRSYQFPFEKDPVVSVLRNEFNKYIEEPIDLAGPWYYPKMIHIGWHTDSEGIIKPKSYRMYVCSWPSPSIIGYVDSSTHLIPEKGKNMDFEPCCVGRKGDIFKMTGHLIHRTPDDIIGKPRLLMRMINQNFE